MPVATVEWDKEALTAILLAASYQLFWSNEYEITNPSVSFNVDESDRVTGCDVSVALKKREKK